MTRWRNAVVPAWMPPHWTWRLFVVGFVVMVALGLSTVLVWAIISDQSNRIAEEDRRIARQAAAKADQVHEQAQQRECESLRERLDSARANDITSLQFQSNLHLDLRTVPLLDPNTRLALALTWERAVRANAFFVLVRLNRTIPIKCVNGKSIQLPYREYGITGQPTVTFFVPQPEGEPLRTTTPPPNLPPESTDPTARGTVNTQTGGGSTQVGGGSGVPGLPPPTTTPTTPTTTCRKVTKKGKCVQPSGRENVAAPRPRLQDVGGPRTSP